MTRHPRPDVAQTITDLILEKIAAGTAPWLKPWSATSTRPLRHNGVPYSGINTFFLWAVAETRGASRPARGKRVQADHRDRSRTRRA